MGESQSASGGRGAGFDSGFVCACARSEKMPCQERRLAAAGAMNAAHGKNRSTCRANLDSLQMCWKCWKTRQRTGPDVKITAVACPEIG